MGIRSQASYSTLAIAMALVLAGGYGCAVSEARPRQAQNEPDIAPAPLALTLFRDDFAQVYDLRPVRLKTGMNSVPIRDLSAEVDQTTFNYSWPARPGVGLEMSKPTASARVVSSTYDLGISDRSQLLQHYLGREVELVYRGDNGRTGDRVKGILEVAEPNNLVVRTGDRWVVNPDATLELPADDKVATRPQLTAQVESSGDMEADLAIEYMTRGLEWQTDYTATLSPTGEYLELEPWATVTNRTGQDFANAQVSFVAGSPNRAVRYQNRGRAGESDLAFAAEATKSATPADIAPTAMGDYYRYDSPGRVTIRAGQMNRVRLMDAVRFPVKRAYSIELPGVSRNYDEGGTAGERRYQAVTGLNFQNTGGNGPLPGGAIRLYGPGAGNATHYLGAASLTDTPKNARVSLSLGEAFDVYATVAFRGAQPIGRRQVRRSYEVTLHNEKSLPATVFVVQPIWGSWRMENQSVRGGKLDSQRQRWQVTVPASQSVTLSYGIVWGMG